MVGLDIGGDSIKVAEAKLGKDGVVTITALGIMRTPEGCVENEVIVDPYTLGAAIKTLLAEAGIKTKKCVSSVGGQSQVVVRVVEVPKMSREELVETMRWEVEKFSFSPDGVEMDFQPIEKPDADPDAQSMSVLLAVAQKELVENHVQALLVAGLQPVAIDIEPLAAGRALISAAQSQDEVEAIIDVGSTITELGVFEGGVLTFPSPPLPIAGINFTREISAALGQPMEQAEITKKEFAAVDLSRFTFPEPHEHDDAPQSSVAVPFSTVFDVAVEPHDAADAAQVKQVPEDAPDGTEAQQFQDTVDGPVFDVNDFFASPVFQTEQVEPSSATGPSFDLGEEPAPGGSEPQPATGPSFDLGDEPVSAGPSFDLGEQEQDINETQSFNLGGLDSEPTINVPSFDLGDDDVASIAPSPGFDFSDLDTQAEQTASPAAGVSAAPAFSSDSMEGQVFSAISNVLVDLATELRRSLDYYNITYSKFPSRIYLCGGTAKMPKLDEFLTRELGVQVVVADPLKNVRVDCPSMSPQYIKELSPLFSVSVGLAIRDMIG